MNNGIVVLGSTFVDIKGFPYGKYIPAGRNAGRVEQVHGGVSRNIAENIAGIGCRSCFVSLVDDSGIGQDVIEHLKQRGVVTDYILKTADGMGTWLAVFDEHGDVVASISKRPDMKPVDGILDRRGDEIFAAADSIVFEFDMEKETASRIFSYAREYDKKVFAAVSNISIAAENRDSLKLLECFVCNEQEASMLFGEKMTRDTMQETAENLLRRIRPEGIRKMVMTMGAHGAVYADAEQGSCGVNPAVPVKTVDTTGAGDAFFSGVAAGLTYGRTLWDSCRIGAAMASDVIGTTESVYTGQKRSDLQPIHST